MQPVDENSINKFIAIIAIIAAISTIEAAPIDNVHGTVVERRCTIPLIDNCQDCEFLRSS